MESKDIQTQSDEDLVLHCLEHCKQLYNWDCGVSCVAMVVGERRAELVAGLDQLCSEEGFGHSTWTIDLCYLLKRFGIQHCMYTINMGVNEDYRRHGYYQGIIDLDRERVTRRFSSAACSGIEVCQRAVSAEQIAGHVRRRGPAIVLVDGGQLACRLCGHNEWRAELRRCFGGSYRGHYVVVAGVTGVTRRRLLYRDPALRARICAVSLARFDAARRASGTDEDVILVHKDYR